MILYIPPPPSTKASANAGEAENTFDVEVMVQNLLRKRARHLQTSSSTLVPSAPLQQQPSLAARRRMCAP